MSGPLDRAQTLLVTPDNPPRDNIDGMDSERCAALHNAVSILIVTTTCERHHVASPCVLRSHGTGILMFETLANPATHHS